MAAGLVRFGVAMDADLLERFDARIAAKGYANRSEALRDLVRSDLVDAHLEAGRASIATLTLVYDHHVRELTERLNDMQHDLGEHVVSTLHVHLDHDHCMEVIVLKGPSALIQTAANRLLATKGVEHGRLVATALPGSQHLPSQPQGHGHGHGAAATPETDATAGTASVRPRKRRPRER